MDKVAPATRRFPLSYKGAPQIRKSALPIVSKTSSLYNFWTVLSFAMTYFRVIPTQAVANFTVQSAAYSCSSNLICLAGSHVVENATNGIEVGRLSLIPEDITTASYTAGIAYYNEQVRLLDPQTNQAASFSTSFTFDVVTADGAFGNGMTFLISEDNSYYSSNSYSGGFFGIFNGVSHATDFKCIVVEFDTFLNSGYPIDDINANHVSFDIMNITGNAPADASLVNVSLTDGNTKYAWVDYSSAAQLLEVRVSYNNTRPMNSLSSYSLDLFDFVEEYMWVGFSSAAGSSWTNFYIGNWTFETYGIPAPNPVVSHSGGRNACIIVGISLGIIAILLACGVVMVRLRRSGVKGIYQLAWVASTKDDQILFEGILPERFSYKSLSVATKGFSEEVKLGQGGFGSVYRGVLPSSGIAVAVKKIKSDSNQGEKEFMTEVSIISQLRHRNLIQLQGWCKDIGRQKLLLVYELMPNGSLDKVLFGPNDSQSACLSWDQRFNVVIGTAAALDYLHLGWKQQVIHRDIKSSNIMLDAEWNTKLGDFGLARLVDHQRAATTTMVAGTYGYIAPEAAATGRFTDKTDVFAFGAVVLEIACGRRAFSIDFPPDTRSLVDWVWKNLSEGALLRSVDERLMDYDTYWMNVVLIVGLWCSHPNPLARPSMRHVVQVLAGDAAVPSIPASKPAAVFSSDPPNITIDSLVGGRFKWGPSSGSKSRSDISIVAMSSAVSEPKHPGKAPTMKSFHSSGPF